MPTRLKQDRSRKSGHKHSLFAQDYANQFNPPHIAASLNLERALMLLQSSPVTEFLGENAMLVRVRKEVRLLMELVKG